MVTALNAFVEIGMFFAFIALIYCIIQIIDVIREERERLMWYRRGGNPVRNDDENQSEPEV
jgi:uncharacterized membrane protein